MALSLTSNTQAAKVTFNTSKLAQGLSINLSKANGSLKRAAVKISWLAPLGAEVDLDINAVRLGKDGKALLEIVPVNYKGRTENVPKDLLFYMNLETEGLKHGGDVVSDGDLEEEQILTATGDQPNNVGAIDYIVTSHVEGNTPLLFKDAGAMSAQLIDLDTNEVLYSTDLDSSTISGSTAAVFATISLDDSGDWNYTTSTRGLGSETQGVQNLLNHYYS